MNAIEKLYSTLIQQFPNAKITTEQAAKTIGLTRGVTSSYLSKLAKQGKLIKSSGRPVYWQIKYEKTFFDQLIGAEGSLKNDIQHAIEAIVYPPYGLPIFITGAEGSGKLFFAKAIYRETIRRALVNKNARFKIIDCEAYTNQSERFREEIISKFSDPAGGDIFLYIKNIQVLSTSDQYYLFTNSKQQKNIRYIYSSDTEIYEKIKDYFKNAIVQIQIEALSKRPFREKISFIAADLQGQADQINKEISISPDQLIKLTESSRQKSIIGLNKYIQLMCAEAYARSDGKKQLVIGKISKNSFLIKAHQNTLQENIDNLYSALIQIDQDPANIFEQLKTSLKEKKPISEQSFLVIKTLNRISTMTNEILSNTFSQTIQQSIKKNITEVYGVSFPQEESFWRNVGSAFLLANIYKDNKKTAGVRYSLQTIIKKNYPRSLYLYKKLLSKLKVPIEHDDYCYLPFFVLMSQSAEKIESIKYNAIILTHGKSTAASIQQVVNSLCGNFLFEAFDMPLDISINEINSYVQEYLNKQSSSTNGNIILFDMGSLGQMFREIKKISNQELLVINDVSTAMALDIGLRIQRNEAFQTIAENSQKYGLTTKAQYYEGLSNKKNIIVSCMSGAGLSEELKKLIETTLSNSLEIITVDYKQLYDLLKNHDKKFFANTRLIMTTTDINSEITEGSGTEIFNVYSVFDQKSSLKLQKVLRESGENQKSINSLIDKLLRFLSIEGIKGRLQILNPDIVIEDSQEIVKHYENFYDVQFDARLKLNLYMHISLMIERMIISRHLQQSTIDKTLLSSQEQDFFSLSSGIFQPLEQKFNITIQDHEIDLLYQLLKDYLS